MQQTLEHLSIRDLNALARQEANKLRPDRQRVTQLVERMCALAPDDADVWRAAGWYYEMVALYTEALACYAHCRALEDTKVAAAIMRVHAVQRGGR